MEAGDVVTALNGKPVDGSGQLTRGVAAIAPGGKAVLGVLRDGKRKELTLTVAQRPESEEALARGRVRRGRRGEGEAAPEKEKAPKDEKLGVKLGVLTPELARQLKLEGRQGVLVAEVTPDGAADRAGLQRGDVILEVNRQPVAKPDQVVDIVGKLKPGRGGAAARSARQRRHLRAGADPGEGRQAERVEVAVPPTGGATAISAPLRASTRRTPRKRARTPS